MALIDDIENSVYQYLTDLKFEVDGETYEDFKIVMDDYLNYINAPLR